MTTRGDIITGGVSGAAQRVAALTANTLIGGDGTDVVTRTTAQMKSSFFLTTYDFSNSTGWTTVDGIGTAAITSGVLRLSDTVGSDGYRQSDVDYNGPSAYRSLGMKDDFDVCVRLAVMSTVSQTYAFLEIADASSAGSRISVRAYHNGNAQFFLNLGGTEIAIAAGRFSSYTGQEWLRLSVRGSRVSAYTGVGSGGSRPTAWTPVGTATEGMFVVWSHISLSMSVVAIGSTSTVDFDDFTTIDHGLGL